MTALLERKLEKATDALRLILDGPAGSIGPCTGWCGGVAMSALAAIEELDTLGECYWHPGQPYTMALRLCNDDGVVETERHGEIVAYDCTGGAHRYGEHILCTSPAHSRGGSR